MQLMPQTAEGLGVDPNDMAGNIEGGTKYLAQLLQQFGGDVHKALEALEKPADLNENTRNSQSTGLNDSTETTGNPSSTNGFSESSSTSTVPQNQQNVKEKSLSS